MRTTYEAGRTALIAKEMENYGISVLGLSETRWIHAGRLTLSSVEVSLFAGHEENDAPHTEEVALVLSRNAAKALISLGPVSFRFVTAKFGTKQKNIK